MLTAAKNPLVTPSVATTVLQLVFLALAVPAPAADRTTLLVPLASDLVTAELPDGVYADQAMGDAASDGWKAYVRIWQAHHQDPADPTIRRFLGLPLTQSFEATAKRGRSSPRWLGWRPGSYAQVDTPHFVIYSRADGPASKRVAEDLERCYWVWTQMFFPLWEAAAQVSGIVEGLPSDQSVQEFLQDNSGRITIRRKLRVVLFRDAEEYQQTLGRDIPGIERSTGFYNDEKQTTFLYASEADDAATRRHEMVHQLFREATRSALGRDIPGDQSGFWLIEGIAGYCESLYIGESFATVGGWDCSRLQYARYRMLVGGDHMPMAELSADGRTDAQQRQDIARWYAHAIAQTHHLLDGGDPGHRGWVYDQLAERYKIRAEIPGNERSLNFDSVDASIRRFLSIDDLHIEANPVHRPLHDLVLAACQVTERGLNLIPPSPHLRWLDLARLPIGNEAVVRLIPDAASLEQLTLEATKTDAALVETLKNASSLRELDLSWTPLDDAVIEAVSSASEMSVLWMTGTNVTDESIDIIARMRNLTSVDLQRTQVTAEGIARLRSARPDLEINPLQLRAAQPQSP